MSTTRSNVRAFLGLVLLACMFAVVTILAQRPDRGRCVRSHHAIAMQPLFAPDCEAASCAGGSPATTRLRAVGFVPMHFEACDAWERDGGGR